LSVTIQPPPAAFDPAPELSSGAELRYAAARTSPQLSATVYALAAFALILHVTFNGGYGFFRDELYYAACGQRLAWGYVDHAPLAPFLARLSRLLLGRSCVSHRANCKPKAFRERYGSPAPCPTSPADV